MRYYVCRVGVFVVQYLWPDTCLKAWGNNSSGKLHEPSATDSLRLCWVRFPGSFVRHFPCPNPSGLSDHTGNCTWFQSGPLLKMEMSNWMKLVTDTEGTWRSKNNFTILMWKKKKLAIEFVSFSETLFSFRWQSHVTMMHQVQELFTSTLWEEVLSLHYKLIF